MDRNIIILAGGASSRMKRSGSAAAVNKSIADEIRNKPKSMLTVGESGRPFLDYLLFNIEKAGYEQAVIVVGEKDGSIRRHYESAAGRESVHNLSLVFVVQKIPDGRDKPLGTADALTQALCALPQWKGLRCTVCNGDNLYSVTALKLLLADEHEGALIDYDRVALQFSEERIAQFAVTMKDEDGFLSDIVEKPSRHELDHLKSADGRIGVSMNIWRFTYERILPFLEGLPIHPVRQEKELPVAVKAMISSRPRSVFAIPLAEHVIDLTTQADIRIVQEYLRKEFPSMQR